MLRRATVEDVPRIQQVYEEAGEFALSRGSTNKWDMNAPYCEKLIRDGELFCSEQDLAVHAAVRLTTAVNVKEWPNGSENHLFIAKLATGNAVRGQGFVPKAMLPEIEDEARGRGMDGLRLNCFPDADLMAFYERCGFENLGVVSFFSESMREDISTAKFQKPLPELSAAAAEVRLSQATM